MDYKDIVGKSFQHTVRAFLLGSLVVVWWLCVWTIAETFFSRAEKYFKIPPLSFNILMLIIIFCFTYYLDPAFLHRL
jgi:hypothetical protein